MPESKFYDPILQLSNSLITCTVKEHLMLVVVICQSMRCWGLDGKTIDEILSHYELEMGYAVPVSPLSPSKNS